VGVTCIVEYIIINTMNIIKEYQNSLISKSTNFTDEDSSFVLNIKRKIENCKSDLNNCKSTGSAPQTREDKQWNKGLASYYQNELDVLGTLLNAAENYDKSSQED
jgi:hypothetical protein